MVFVCETLHIGINLPVHSFTMVEEIFENCVCETLHGGINLSIQSFTMVEENFENWVCL